jgi:transcriptional regulator with XRE-family HTH domain
MGLAGPLSSVSLALTKASLKAPAKGAALTKAAAALMQARKSLGMTAQDLARAIDLKSPELIEQAESGKAGLPFEVILRLAAVLGRNDPMAFALKLVRSYNPALWVKLEAIGVGKLVEHVGREREFVNIYRSSDAARSLSDEEFAQVLTFVESAFEMALAFKLGER